MHEEFALGLDLGGTTLKAARVDRAGTVLAFHEAPSRVLENAEGALLAFEAARAQLDPRAECVGIGLGCPGMIDPESGALVGRTPHLPHWQDFPLRERVSARLGAAVVVDNDANAAAFAEHLVGAARGSRVSLTVTLGTGLGCGIVVDGRVYRGAGGGAGELGHTPLGRGALACDCGIADCVEPATSGEGLAREARARGLGDLDARAVFALAATGDAIACDLVARFSDRLGATLATAIQILNPDCVVVGGGVAAAGRALFDPLAQSIERYALASHRRGLRVVPAALGPRAGCVGAALLAFDAGGSTA